VAAVDTAILAAAAGSLHFPSPTEIRELAGAATPTAKDRAVLTFQALREAISRIGGFRSPDFDDALINAVVRNLGGWQRACEMSLSEFYGAYRGDYLCLYEMFCRIKPNDAMTAPLVGECEQSSLANGYYEAAARERVKVKTGLPWAEA